MEYECIDFTMILSVWFCLCVCHHPLGTVKKLGFSLQYFFWWKSESSWYFESMGLIELELLNQLAPNSGGIFLENRGVLVSQPL